MSLSPGGRATPVVVHADESCLGNDASVPSPGGAGALIEVATSQGIARRDLYISAPATTNNRMALNGAIATFAILSRKHRRLTVAYVSDSEYLVKGITEWAPAWEARGWRRKGGEVQNLALWQTLVRVTKRHAVHWRWVRGHAGDPKNEYADHLAVRAAREQVHSDEAVPSEFAAWLADRRARGQFLDYDPDEAFRAAVTALER